MVFWCEVKGREKEGKLHIQKVNGGSGLVCAPCDPVRMYIVLMCSNREVREIPGLGSVRRRVRGAIAASVGLLRGLGW